MTSDADTIDLVVAASSGVITAAIDAILKEKRLSNVFGADFSDKDLLDYFNESGAKKVNEKIEKKAQDGKTLKKAKESIEKDGSLFDTSEMKADKLSGMVSYFEKRFSIPSDSMEKYFGGGTTHHLNDFAHHPSIIGLIFSLLTQFTEKCYGTDKIGKFIVVPLENINNGMIARTKGDGTQKSIRVIGRNKKEKLFFGITVWYYHLISDMAGSSGTIRSIEKHNLSALGVGAGIPGPLMSLAKALSALPIFTTLNKNGKEENKFAQKISEIYDGSAFAKIDEYGKKVKRKVDYRTEIGIKKELADQAKMVIVNEIVVRGFYFIRRLAMEVKEKKIKNIKGFDKIDRQRIMPFKNRTVVRMMTVASTAFVATNLTAAAIQSAGNPAQFVLRINVVGVGRCVVAIGVDIVEGIKKSQLENNWSIFIEKEKTISLQLEQQNAEIANDVLMAITEEREQSLDDLIMFMGGHRNE